MNGYSPILELGGDPLTPREKVEREVLDAVFSGFEHGQCEKEWEPEYGKEIASKATDAILTALASGSGDHAELARLADDPAMDFGGFGRSSVSALLAENAALRAERDRVEADRIRGVDDRMAWTRRALEAERKLAEADRLLERIANDPTWDGPSSARLYFLNKEAERG